MLNLELPLGVLVVGDGILEALVEILKLEEEMEVKSLGFLEARVLGLKKREFWRIFSSDEMRKEKGEVCKRMGFIGWGFCKGDGICVERRGLSVKGKA